MELDDGSTIIARVHRSLTIFPWAMDLVFRATIIFFFIFLITRIAGRRELSSLENVRWATLEKQGSISFIPNS